MAFKELWAKFASMMRTPVMKRAFQLFLLVYVTWQITDMAMSMLGMKRSESEVALAYACGYVNGALLGEKPPKSPPKSLKPDECPALKSIAARHGFDVTEKAKN